MMQLFNQNREIKLENLRDSNFLRDLEVALEPYIVIIFNSKDGPEGGSGSLVCYNGIKGILTASHVAAYFSKKNTLYLPCVLRPGSEDIWDTIEVSFVKILTIDNLELFSSKNFLESSLDISLIQFDDSCFTKILKSWRKKPLDLAEMNSNIQRKNI